VLQAVYLTIAAHHVPEQGSADTPSLEPESHRIPSAAL